MKKSEEGQKEALPPWKATPPHPKRGRQGRGEKTAALRASSLTDEAEKKWQAAQALREKKKKMS